MLSVKKALTIIVTVLLICPFCGYSQAHALEVSAQRAILMEQESGRILFEKNAHTVSRIASITKIMTALLAIESGKLKEKVKINSEAIDVEGSSIYLEKGERLTLEDLVYGLLLRSGNDAAVAIANHVGGSMDGFVYMMNQRAKEIGMSDTVFSNPHGLDDSEEHYSTAYDMALLTQHAMKNDTFRKMFATEKYRAPKEGEQGGRRWINKNKLLTGLYKYSTGGKTGYTKRAKRTLVSTANKDGMDLIAVTLNAPDDWNDHIFLFEQAFATYELKTLVEEGKYEAVQDDFYRGKLTVKRPVTYPLSEEEQKQLTSSLTLYHPPQEDEWESGHVPTPVGKLYIKCAGEQIATVPLFFEGDPVNRENKSYWEIFLIVIGVDKR